LQPLEQKGFFLGVVQALREFLKVGNDGVQQGEVWCEPPAGVFTDEILHSLHYRGKGSMLVADDAQR
jgi:hypothetical protein